MIVCLVVVRIQDCTNPIVPVLILTYVIIEYRYRLPMHPTQQRITAPNTIFLLALFEQYIFYFYHHPARNYPFIILSSTFNNNKSIFK